MKTILSIFRWLFGLSLGLFLFITILITMPLSIAGKQLFERQSGMAWLTAFTEDKTAVSQMMEGIYDSVASSSSIDDPTLKQASKFAADKNSPLGSSVRKVLTPEIVSEDLVYNADVIYTWLEGKSSKLPFVLKIGGTSGDQVGLVSSFMKVRYDQLSSCSASERKDLGKVDSSNILAVPCSIGSISSATFESAAKKLLSEPETKKVITQGFNYDATVTDKNREEVLAMKKVLSSGIIFSWVVVVISSLFMVLLFTPSGVNYITTGLIVGMTGLSLGGFGLAVNGIAQVLQETLGRHIAAQGLYIAVFGLLLICVGIWQIIKKKEPVEVVKKIEPVVIKKEEVVKK